MTNKTEHDYAAALKRVKDSWYEIGLDGHLMPDELRAIVHALKIAQNIEKWKAHVELYGTDNELNEREIE